jgi:methionyl-tRNA formyltransferase
MRISLVGAVESTDVALRVLLGRGLDPLVLTLPPELGSRHSDYVDLGDRHPSHRSRIIPIDRIAAPAAVQLLEHEAPEMLFVFGWSQICPPSITSIATRAALGCHPSALPRNRGRAVIPWTILQQLRETAMSVFHLADDVDAGDLVVQVPVELVPRETARTLYDKQLVALQRALEVVLDGLDSGDELPRVPQDHASASWCARRDAEDGRLDFHCAAADVDRLIRASTLPYPGAFTTWREATLRVWSAHDVDAGWCSARPGQVIGSEGDKVTVMCGDHRAVTFDDWELGASSPRLPLHDQLGTR